MTIKIYTDGASRGNPGLAGAGAVIYKDGVKFAEVSEFLGEKTNNEAEYQALILVLKKIVHLVSKREFSVDESYEFYADSQLMIRQLNGEYKVKAPKVVPLFESACDLSSELNCRFFWIKREENSEADALANRAIDMRNNK